MAQIPERTLEDRASGILRITVGGQTKRLPTLPMRATAEWQESLGERFTAFTKQLAADQSAQSLAGFATFTHEAILDAVVAYDRTGALGGREWLADNADPEQLYVAFRQMAEVAFPFVKDVQGLLALLPGLVAQQVAESASPSSTNGHSPSGVSIPSASKSDSTQSS